MFGFAITNPQGDVMCGSNTINDDFNIDAIDGSGSVTLTLSTKNLLRGTYLLSLSLHSRDHKTNYHRLDNMYKFLITPTTSVDGIVNIPSSWQA